MTGRQADHKSEAINRLAAEARARGWEPDAMTLSYWTAVVEALFDSSKTVWVVPLEGAPETLREHATTLERHLAGEGALLSFVRIAPWRDERR